MHKLIVISNQNEYEFLNIAIPNIVSEMQTKSNRNSSPCYIVIQELFGTEPLMEQNHKCSELLTCMSCNFLLLISLEIVSIKMAEHLL